MITDAQVYDDDNDGDDDNEVDELMMTPWATSIRVYQNVWKSKFHDGGLPKLAILPN